MRHGKTTALKCLPLATELLIVFLTADILWQLLCGRPPFSMWGFLLSGGLMTAGNSLFLQKPRRFWQILLLNVLLCAVWIPLLSRTLDLTYPPLLVIQVPLYLFPLCRGYHWGVTPVTVRHLHGAGEYMGLYGLFYLIVASFAPQLLDRVPVLLALLALDLLAVVGMRTSGRNTIRAGSPFGRLPALQKPRRFWQILLLNVLLCAVWIPLLSRTLDLTYPPLLVIQVPLYLFPLCRGYHWGVTPVTVRHLHGAGEYMGLYGLFYLIVASFAPQLLDRVPVLLALLALDLLAVVGMRTSGRNTIRAGSPFGRLPALLVPAVLALLAVAACALLLAARGELIPIFQAVGSLLEGALIAAFRFLTSLFQGRSAGSAGMSSAAGGGSEAALPVESASGPAIAPQLVTALLLLSLAALVLAGVAALVRWLWHSRSRIRLPEEDDDDGLVRQRLGRRGLLYRLGQRLRVRAFLLWYAGTPRAALLELERWGARRRCRRQSQETPREYLERLAGDPLRDALDTPMQARYAILVDDVERSLYSTLPPRLSREQVRELLSTVHRSTRTPPARAK